MMSRASQRIGVETRYTCWGAGIVDLDNDGFPDLFMVTGNVYPEIEEKLCRDTLRKSPRVLFRNLGNGTFEELWRKRVLGSSRRTAAAAALSATSTTTAIWTS